MTLGNWIEAIITWGSAALGAWALLHHARRRWGWRVRLAIIQVRGIIDHYVVRWHELQFQRNPDLADTYQLEPLSEPPRTTGTELVPNRETLIRIAALTTNEDGSYTYSANKIAEFIGGTRTDVLAAIRAVRGTPEPQPVDTHIFEQTGPRQTFKRTGVKPLRG